MSWIMGASTLRLELHPGTDARVAIEEDDSDGVPRLVIYTAQARVVIGPARDKDVDTPLLDFVDKLIDVLPEYRKALYTVDETLGGPDEVDP